MPLPVYRCRILPYRIEVSVDFGLKACETKIVFIKLKKKKTKSYITLNF